MLQTCDVGFVSRRRGRGRGLLMLDVARNTGRNIFATWSQHVGEGEERRPMLDVAHNFVRNMLGTHSQHPSLNVARTTFATWEKLFATSQKFFRNILCVSQPDRRLIGSPHPNRAAQHPSDTRYLYCTGRN
jgi:hypothetical protein